MVSKNKSTQVSTTFQKGGWVQALKELTLSVLEEVPRGNATSRDSNLHFQKIPKSSFLGFSKLLKRLNLISDLHEPAYHRATKQQPFNNLSSTNFPERVLSNMSQLEFLRK